MGPGRAEDPLVKVLFFCKLAEAGPTESAAYSRSACFAQIKRSNLPLQKVVYFTSSILSVLSFIQGQNHSKSYYTKDFMLFLEKKQDGC